MAATPSSITGLATPSQRAWKILTIVLTGIAVAASMAWTPALLSISIALDPGRNSGDPIENYSAAQQQAMIAQAKQQFSIIALICLVALMALVALAIAAGRRALRETASTATLARIGRWSLVCLVGGLALAPVIFLIRFGNAQFYYSYIEQPIRQLSPLLAQVVVSMALGLIPASQVVSVILSGIALLRRLEAPGDLARLDAYRNDPGKPHRAGDVRGRLSFGCTLHRIYGGLLLLTGDRGDALDTGQRRWREPEPPRFSRGSIVSRR